MLTEVKKRGALEIREPVAVFGVGQEGRATIEYLLKMGFQDITALDRNEIPDLPKNISAVFGADHDQRLERFATIFRSPGIRPDHPSLTYAQKEGTNVTSAISHFLEVCAAPTTCITGTVGKGTAASLTAQMLSASGITVHLAGNIGASPLAFASDIKKQDHVVLEVSSFQAMDLKHSPQIGVILKTTSEHLDWHVDLDEYLDAKATLIRFQKAGDIVIFDADSRGAERIAAVSKARHLAFSLKGEVLEGLFLRGEHFILRDGQSERELPIHLERVRLPGRFNLENIAAALLVTSVAKADVERACQVAEEFEGLPHRLEFVAEGGDIRFYNDSYATRPEAAIGALSCFKDSRLAVILGGSEKFADFEELGRALVDHPLVVQACLIGETARRLARAIDGAGQRKFNVVPYDTLESAMEGAVAALGMSGSVLLTPACASFGLFPNYKIRGERFRAKAHALSKDLAARREYQSAGK